MSQTWIRHVMSQCDVTLSKFATLTIQILSENDIEIDSTSLSLHLSLSCQNHIDQSTLICLVSAETFPVRQIGQLVELVFDFSSHERAHTLQIMWMQFIMWGSFLPSNSSRQTEHSLELMLTRCAAIFVYFFAMDWTFLQSSLLVVRNPEVDFLCDSRCVINCLLYTRF